MEIIIVMQLWKNFLASNGIARRDLLKQKIKFHAIKPKVNENKLKDIFKNKVL